MYTISIKKNNGKKTYSNEKFETLEKAQAQVKNYVNQLDMRALGQMCLTDIKVISDTKTVVEIIPSIIFAKGNIFTFEIKNA